jgi:hypothetical protein
MPATFRAEIGPCDDDAHFFMNGAPAVTLRLNQSRTISRTLDDGDYEIRLMVINSGGWAWRARVRALVNGEEVWSVDSEGGSGFYTGPVFDENLNFAIRNGIYEQL